MQCVRSEFLILLELTAVNNWVAEREHVDKEDQIIGRRAV